jgi:hypothetical protein
VSLTFCQCGLLVQTQRLGRVTLFIQLTHTTFQSTLQRLARSSANVPYDSSFLRHKLENDNTPSGQLYSRPVKHLSMSHRITGSVPWCSATETLICLWTIYEESTACLACVRGSRVHSKPGQAPHNSLGLPTFELVNSAKLDYNSTYVPPPTPHGNLGSPLCIVFVHVHLPDPLAFTWYTLANVPSIINHRIVVNHDGLRSEQSN